MALNFKKKKKVAPGRGRKPIHGGVNGWKSFIELGDNAYCQIQFRLMSGDSVRKVAEYLQKELGVLLDIKAESLARYLHRFKRDVVDPKIIRAYEHLREPARNAAVDVLKSRIDGMAVLEKEVEDQIRRVNKVRFREEKMPEGILLSDLSTAKKQLTDLVERLIRLQMDSGFLQKVGNAPVVQVNNTMLNIAVIQEDIKSRNEIAAATQEALRVMIRRGAEDLPSLPIECDYEVEDDD